MEQNEWKVPPDNTLQVAEKDDMPPERSRNWVGLCVSLAIIGAVLMLIAIAAVLLIPLQKPPFTGRRLCIKDIDEKKFVAEPLVSQWVSDQEFAYFSSSGDLAVRDVTTQEEKVLISRLMLNRIGAKDFTISSNRRFILLVHDILHERLYKRTAKYTVYDSKGEYYYPLNLNPKNIGHQRFQFVQWLKASPYKRRDNESRSDDSTKAFDNSDSSNFDTSTDHDKQAESFVSKREAMDDYQDDEKKRRVKNEIVIVYQNDVYLLSKPKGSFRRLTNDGETDVIFNGVPDLLYEEIMVRSSTVWISPNSSYLALVSINNTEVTETPVLLYNTAGQEPPFIRKLKYPTVNSLLPQVSVWLFTLDNMQKVQLIPPNLLDSPYYLIDVGWASEDEVWVTWISRDQSTSLLTICKGKNWKCDAVHVNKLKEGSSPVQRGVKWLNHIALFPWPIQMDDDSFHNHVEIVGGAGEKHPPLPTGEHDVTEVVAVNKQSQVVYFMGSELSTGSSTNQLFRVSLNQSQESRVMCISCSLNCPRVTASINKRQSYAVLNCVGTHLPSMNLIDLRSGKVIRLHQQDTLRTLFSDLALPFYIRRDITLSPGLRASVLLTLPPGFRFDDDSLLFPLVVQIIGIEKYHEKDNTLRLGWVEILPSAYHVAHAQVQLWGTDPRQHTSTKDLTNHMQRIIEVLVTDYPFFEEDELYAWGWGTGASMAMKLASATNFKLKCVVAINPIADWRMFGSYWSERQLGPLSSPGSGRLYEESSLAGGFDAFNSTNLMLVQSQNDPLSQHSSRLAQKMVELGLQFNHVVYPNSNGALRDRRQHLLKSMANFFLQPKCIQSYFGAILEV